jgi:hypothetical protein
VCSAVAALALAAADQVGAAGCSAVCGALGNGHHLVGVDNGAGRDCERRVHGCHKIVITLAVGSRATAMLKDSVGAVGGAQVTTLVLSA